MEKGIYFDSDMKKIKNVYCNVNGQIRNIKEIYFAQNGIHKIWPAQNILFGEGEKNAEINFYWNFTEKYGQHVKNEDYAKYNLNGNTNATVEFLYTNTGTDRYNYYIAKIGKFKINSFCNVIKFNITTESKTYRYDGWNTYADAEIFLSSEDRADIYNEYNNTVLKYEKNVRIDQKQIEPQENNVQIDVADVVTGDYFLYVRQSPGYEIQSSSGSTLKTGTLKCGFTINKIWLE